MKLMSACLVVALLTFAQRAHADLDSEIYQGILAEAKETVNVENQSRLGPAQLFASVMGNLVALKHGDLEPMKFSLTTDLGDVQLFVGKTQLHFMNGPVC